MIDPEFWQDPLIGALAANIRLFFVFTWQIADDSGLFEADQRRLRALAFAYDDGITSTDVVGYVARLEELGRLLPYVCNDRRYEVVRHFHRYQRLDRPTMSKLPRPPDEVLCDLEQGARDRILKLTSPHATEPHQLIEGSATPRRTFGEHPLRARSQTNLGELKETEINRSATHPLFQLEDEPQMYPDGRIRDSAGTHSSWDAYVTKQQATRHARMKRPGSSPADSESRQS